MWHLGAAKTIKRHKIYNFFIYTSTNFTLTLDTMQLPLQGVCSTYHKKIQIENGKKIK